MNEKELNDLLNTLTQQRNEFVANANLHIANLNGRIAILQELLHPTTTDTTTAATDAPTSAPNATISTTTT